VVRMGEGPKLLEYTLGGAPPGGEKGGDLGMNSTGEAQLLVILINYRYIFIHLIETYYMFKFRCTCDTC
jgi:hypothetical protein